MNKIIVIGYIGSKSCYLNIEKEEAIKRYCEVNKISIEEFDEKEFNLDVIEFYDVFIVY
jgi:hypothetical protein